MSLALNMSELERLRCLLPELDLADAVPALAHLVRDPVFQGAQILPLLERGSRAGEPYIAHTYGVQERSACLQIFVWPAGSSTQIHDHTSWGAYCCAAGSLLEERYERLDDSAQPHTARLRKLWQRVWRSGDGVSTVLPYEGGIHRIANPNDRPVVSMHLYGPRMGVFDGRDYDPSRDFVCDRLETGGPPASAAPERLDRARYAPQRERRRIIRSLGGLVARA